ncbi:MAG: class II fructose-bisphosphate aldolase [Candidatus Omnitrophota bacterium]|jgi:ketose-bisphosphate aldolase|nr:MAG: class II fructose-bisphosphate aldolase [Candidatus Omnitrophota bacterium]
MGLESMKGMLAKAGKEQYGVGAFNTVDYASTKAAVTAAEELAAPIIIQTSVKTVQLWGHATVVTWMKDIAANSPVPVALHLDHCKDPDFIRQCIDAGWTSVMIDASAKPFEENLAITRQVFEMADAAGVGLEAELGEIGGVEDDKSVADEDAYLADPDKAEMFCKDLPLAVFAPAIGTAHGVYKGEPKIAFDRLEEIAKRTGLPIALHGGTGLSDDVFKRCIALGCAKVNISTQLKYTFIDSFVNYHQDHQAYEPVKVLTAQMEAIRKTVVDYIRLFGSEGKGK